MPNRTKNSDPTLEALKHLLEKGSARAIKNIMSRGYSEEEAAAMAHAIYEKYCKDWMDDHNAYVNHAIRKGFTPNVTHTNVPQAVSQGAGVAIRGSSFFEKDADGHYIPKPYLRRT